MGLVKWVGKHWVVHILMMDKEQEVFQFQGGFIRCNRQFNQVFDLLMHFLHVQNSVHQLRDQLTLLSGLSFCDCKIQYCCFFRRSSHFAFAFIQRMIEEGWYDCSGSCKVSMVRQFDFNTCQSLTIKKNNSKDIYVSFFKKRNANKLSLR